jgi:hypothetical protein
MKQFGNGLPPVLSEHDMSGRGSQREPVVELDGIERDILPLLRWPGYSDGCFSVVASGDDMERNSESVSFLNGQGRLVNRVVDFCLAGNARD